MIFLLSSRQLRCTQVMYFSDPPPLICVALLNRYESRILSKQQH